MFPDDNSCLDWLVVFKLHIYVSLVTQGRPLLILGSKVKVTGEGSLRLPTNSFMDGNSCLD